jgi:hypothetical protein
MKTIFVIRHAEKPEGDDQGVDQKGSADEEALIVRGWQRAGALAVFFGSTEGLPAPDRIYAAAAEKHHGTSDAKVGSKSKRPTETVTPLAAKLGQTIDGTWSKGQEKELVNDVTALDGTTLVCWQHEAIPQIAGLILGSAKGVPSPWPGDRFDVVWRFTSSGSGGWTFDQVCQQVLAGDSAQPIT